MARGNQRPRRTPTMGGLSSQRPTQGVPLGRPRTRTSSGLTGVSPGERLRNGDGIKYDAQGRAVGWVARANRPLEPGQQGGNPNAIFTNRPVVPPANGGNPMIAPNVGGVLGQNYPKAPTWQDSEYATGVNELIQSNATERTAITGAGQRDEQNLATMIRQMTQARGEDLLGANSGANRQGLLFSSTLGKQRGGIERDYAARQGAAQTAFNDRAADRMAALNRLGTITADPNSPNGFTATGDALASLGGIIAAARARRVVGNEEIEAPITAGEDRPPATQPSSPAANLTPAQRYAQKPWRTATDSKRGGAWHIYKDGRKVFVKGARY